MYEHDLMITQCITYLAPRIAQCPKDCNEELTSVVFEGIDLGKGRIKCKLTTPLLIGR